MVSSKTEHAPYRYDHAKYVIIDNNSLLLTSENFKNSGLPPEGNERQPRVGCIYQRSWAGRIFYREFLQQIPAASQLSLTREQQGTLNRHLLRNILPSSTRHNSKVPR